jgi:hypothetical protein
MLTQAQHDLLAFEEAHPKTGDAKETLICERFDCSAALYYLRLNVLILSRDAIAAYPQLAKRLLRQREMREQKRHRQRQVLAESVERSAPPLPHAGRSDAA